jgi:flavin reductase (DIM6/NTAB) family NADH-FMN oxidoreductase RutF
MATLQTLDVSSGFRTAMRRLATTVSVVTCADEDGWE